MADEAKKRDEIPLRHGFNHEHDPLIVEGHPDVWDRLRRETPVFRSDAAPGDWNVWYLTGFDHPGATAVLRTDGGPAYTLFVEPRDRAMETWNGYRPGVEGAVQDFGADEAHPNDELLDKLAGLIRSAQRIYHTLGRDAAFDARLVAALDQMRLRSRANADPADAIVDARSITHPMRLVKEPAELDLMRRAAEISREGHAAAARLAWPGAFEYELQAALEYSFRKNGARGPAYESILAGTLVAAGSVPRPGRDRAQLQLDEAVVTPE